MISIKTYKQGEDTLVGACDETLLGKKFNDGKFHLDISEKFYKGQKIKAETLKHHLEKATVANLAGKKTVDFAIKLGFIESENVLNIKGVPYAQMVRMI